MRRMAKTRSLPALADLAADVAQRLGGVARTISTAEHAHAAAIAWDDAHLLLLRDHGWTLTFSLPVGRSWSMQTPAELDAAEPEIREAVSSCARVLTLSDALLALAPSFPELAPSFPGTPVPREAWMRDATASVGLFQGDGGVRVVVWIEHAAAECTVARRAQLPELASWLRPRIEQQRAARIAAEAEAARRAALPPPDFAAVLELLHSGARVSTGGGRWHETYYVKDGRLCRDVFDEGITDELGASEGELRKAIATHPDAFRDALDQALRRKSATSEKRRPR
jgi:hypothetical protein